MCLTAKKFGLQEKTSTSPNIRERPLIIRKTGWGTAEREERQRDRKRGRERKWEGGCRAL